MDLVNGIAASATVAMGLFGLLFPARAAAFVGLSPITKAGQSEFRATYGGLWLPLGAVPLVSGEASAYAMAGLCWLGAAGGRVISILLDHAGDRHNWFAVGFETVFAIALLAGRPLAWLVG